MAKFLKEEWVPGAERVATYLRRQMPWDQHGLILAQPVEGNVYQIGPYVVKERARTSFGTVCNPCVYREFLVGKIANQIKSPFLVKTLGYFEMSPSPNERYSYIVTEMVEGRTLWSYSDENSNYVAIIIWHVLNALLDLQHRLQFTHNDLHWGNIIVKPLDKPETRSLYSHGKLISLDLTFQVTIIDLGRSHVKGIPPSWYETAIIGGQQAPGVFDPQIDLTYLMNPVIRFARISKKEEVKAWLEMMEANRLVEEDGFDYLLDYPEFMTGKLLRNNRGWAASEPNGLEMQELIDIFLTYMVGLDVEMAGPKSIEEYKEDILRKIGEEIDETDPDFWKFVGNGVDENLPSPIQEHFVKQLGESIVTTKLRRMSERPHGTEEIFNQTFIALAELTKR